MLALVVVSALAGDPFFDARQAADRAAEDATDFVLDVGAVGVAAALAGGVGAVAGAVAGNAVDDRATVVGGVVGGVAGSAVGAGLACFVVDRSAPLPAVVAGGAALLGALPGAWFTSVAGQADDGGVVIVGVAAGFVGLVVGAGVGGAVATALQPDWIVDGDAPAAPAGL